MVGSLTDKTIGTGFRSNSPGGPPGRLVHLSMKFIARSDSPSARVGAGHVVGALLGCIIKPKAIRVWLPFASPRFGDSNYPWSPLHRPQICAGYCATLSVEFLERLIGQPLGFS